MAYHTVAIYTYIAIGKNKQIVAILLYPCLQRRVLC